MNKETLKTLAEEAARLEHKYEKNQLGFDYCVICGVSRRLIEAQNWKCKHSNEAYRNFQEAATPKILLALLEENAALLKEQSEFDASMQFIISVAETRMRDRCVKAIDQAGGDNAEFHMAAVNEVKLS